VTSLPTIPVVRRSALEAAHTALGARWIADDVHWPADYGPDDAPTDLDSRAVAEGAGLAEVGPHDELLLRGPGALAAVARLATGGFAASVGQVVTVELGNELAEAWLLGPDEILLLARSDGSAVVTLAGDLASDEVSAIVMTGARTALRLAGPAAPAILAELCPADTTTSALSPGHLIQAPLVGVRAFIARADNEAGAGYTILIARDEAAYAWDAIRRIGSGRGLVPVGPAAVAPKDAVRASSAAAAPAGGAR
jgi:heterotetrameric sarcosine oxidase gamma subunit